MNFLIFFLTFLIIVSSARKTIEAEPKPETVDTPSATKVYQHACHPQRFSDMGLNITDYTYCDSSLSYEIRVKDLIDRMTLYEKSQQISDSTTGLERIGLPKYKWWSEALHGVASVGPWWYRNKSATFFDHVVSSATSFPTPITTASTFNETLWKTIGQAISTEARAMYNLGRAGLTFWTPNINIVRDPRWGRALETLGEDPYLVGKYAVNHVRGLQDVEGTTAKDINVNIKHRPLKVSACCKHYAAYDVDNWNGVVREIIDAKVTEQDMVETFLKPFEMCVKEGDVSSVMCSYNRINGVPACADPRLLRETLRGEWDLNGYIVSDCDSVEVMVDRQHWLSDSFEDAVAQTLKAGLDLDCGLTYSKHGANAVEQGKVKESEVDRALKNLYMVLMRVGFFDGNPRYNKLGKKDICSKEHIDLALQAAREGIVLLKNDGETLPLSTNKINTLAVVGPHANATEAMIGNYAGIPCRYTSPLYALSKEVKSMIYKPGCIDVQCKNSTHIFPAMKAAKKSDATIILAGIDTSIEREYLDRTDLLLPGYQTLFINQTAMTSKGPVILVILSGGGVDISFAKGNPNITAILWAGYPGEEGGQAIADIIFGKHNPSGRLPLTWYENNYVHKIPMTSMSLRPLKSLGYPGRTYKFFKGHTVYQFGHGLSYTTWIFNLIAPKRSLDVHLNKFQHCRDLNYTSGSAKPLCPSVKVDDLVCDKMNIDFDVEVQNAGKVDGSEVVLVFSAAPKGIVGAPIRRVVEFKKVFVAKGQKRKVHFRLNGCRDLGIVEYSGYNLLASGKHSIILGNWVASFPFSVNLKPSV